MWVDECRGACEEAARRFLCGHEFRCVRASENLRLYVSNPALREFFSVYIHIPGIVAASCIDGLAVADADGALCVLLPDSPSEDHELAMMLRRQDALPRISGPLHHVRRIVSALDGAGWLDRSYLLMRASSMDMVVPPTDARIEVRDAKTDDLDALLSLQMAYEREELNLRPTRSDTMARIQSLLEQQMVVIAFCGDEPVGKVNTNARGYFYDQIGGFYVKPAYRSKGIGKAVLFHLLRRIKEEQRDPVLFVRPENVPAISVYRRAGFLPVGDYGVSTRGTRRMS
jgi:ribosomal protein S18 acetylase RimI-like enzyme